MKSISTEEFIGPLVAPLCEGVTIWQCNVTKLKGLNMATRRGAKGPDEPHATKPPASNGSW